jgi:hypothetical protein
MNYFVVSILDGKGDFKCTVFASSREGVLKAIEYEHWVSYQSFSDEKKDFIPVRYQVAAAEIFTNLEGEPVLVGRWGRNTGVVWYESDETSEKATS